MPREGEHVETFRLPGFVTELCEEPEVAGEGFGPAGNVNDPGGVHGNCSPDEFGCGALAGWIHEKDQAAAVPVGAVGGHGGEGFSGVGTEKADVLKTVPLGILPGVADCIFIEFDGQNVLCRAGGGHADGADAGVGIDHGGLLGESGEIDGFLVEFFGHQGVNLIEGGGGNAEAKPGEFVFDEAAAIEDRVFRAEDQRSLSVIQIEDGSGDLWAVLFEGVGKVFLSGEPGAPCDDDKEHFTGLMGGSDEEVADQPVSRVFVIVRQMKIVDEFSDAADGLHRAAVFDQAVPDLDDLMCPFSVDTARPKLFPPS